MDEELDLDAVVVINAATGRRVTVADMEAEAREFDRMRGLIPGGKSLSGDGSHSAALRPWLERRRNPAYRPTLPPQLSDCH